MNFASSFFQSSFLESLWQYLPILVGIGSFIFKLAIMYGLYRNKHVSKNGKPFIYLLVILVTAACIDLVYINFFVYKVMLDLYPFAGSTTKALLRIVFVMLALNFHALLFFFRELSSNKVSSRYIKALLPITFFFVVYFIYKVVHTFSTGILEFTPFYWIVAKLHAIYYLALGLASLLLMYRNYKIEKINLLRHHIKTLGKFFMLPYFVVAVFDSYFFSPKSNMKTVVMLTGLLSYMLFYCLRRLIRMRFLNIQKHVEAQKSKSFSFPRDFMNVIGGLGSIFRPEELIPVTKKFFKEGFKVPEDKVHLYFRNSLFNKAKGAGERDSKREVLVERFFSPGTEDPNLVTYVKKNKILIRDEEEFTHFYETENVRKETGFSLGGIVKFLQGIRADVFLPIFSGGKLEAYVIIDKGARDNLFTDVERDEMLIFCNYVSSVVYFLTNVNIETVLERERKSQEEMYRKSKILDLINKSEDIDPGERKIGILTYRNKKFNYINQDAKDILKADLNRDKGLDLTKKIFELAVDSAKFLTHSRTLVPGTKGETLLVIIAPNLERNNTVITVSHATKTDLLKDKISNLKDKSKWPFLLALITTEDGKLVDNLIPADTNTLLDNKISFFEHATTRKKIMLELPSENDARSFAYVAHKLHKRVVFEEIMVDRDTDQNKLAKRLFGVNPFFEQAEERSLFGSLSEKGTILIQNVHLLNLDVQKKLLEFISTGKFTPIKSDERIRSDVLLLCSSNQNLLDFVQRDLFLKELYIELRKSAVWLSSLTSLPEEEFLALAEGFRQQVVSSKIYQNLLVFTDYDQKRLLASNCVSLSELKAKVKNIITKKTQRHSIKGDSILDPAYSISDLDLAAAARLGKDALKDPKMLHMLMIKFDYSQSKVATFLNVNRSSVSRRCTEYGIENPEEQKNSDSDE